MSNKHLQTAKQRKNDEFYTRYSYIEEELQHYWKFFKDKYIYCPCDNPDISNFWKYFSNNFENMKLGGLSATYYNPNGKGEFAQIGRFPTLNGNDKYHLMRNRDKLPCNGDFTSEELCPFFTMSDIVITNIPFSLARQFFDLMFKYDKKFIILGSLNMITYKNIFPRIASGEIKLGYNFDKQMKFTKPDGSIFSLGGCCWFTNLDIKTDRWFEFSGITYNGNEDKYPKYDNYDAINVDRVRDIPCDYDGVMGVPITFLGKYNPKQFKIVQYVNGLTWNRERKSNTLLSSSHSTCILGLLTGRKETKHGDKSSFCRVLIQRNRE